MLTLGAGAAMANTHDPDKWQSPRPPRDPDPIVPWMPPSLPDWLDQNQPNP